MFQDPEADKVIIGTRETTIQDSRLLNGYKMYQGPDLVGFCTLYDLKNE